MMNDVDLFIFYDDVQYTGRNWRNRNCVKTPNGKQWLTVPVNRGISKSIDETLLIGSQWRKKHLHTLQTLYGKAPYFGAYAHVLDFIYREHEWVSLSELNQSVNRFLAQEILGIQCDFADVRTLGLGNEKTDKVDRVLRLMELTGAHTMVNGPAILNYMNHEDFHKRGFQLEIKDYSRYPDYSQFHPPFEHGVTILDLVFHVGPAAPEYIWGMRDR